MALFYVIYWYILYRLCHKQHKESAVQHLFTTTTEKQCCLHKTFSIQVYPSQSHSGPTQTFLCFRCFTLCFLANRMLRRNFGSTCTSLQTTEKITYALDFISFFCSQNSSEVKHGAVNYEICNTVIQQ